MIQLRLETDLIREALTELCAVHQRLAHRHGEAFRTLERRIDSFDEAPDIHHLGAGIFIAAPSPALGDLLAEARRLGV